MTKRLSVVVPTINGPRSNIPRLLESIREQIVDVQQIVIVYQGDERVEDLRASWGIDGEEVAVVRSPKGLSMARNIGILSLTAEWDFVAIPDDDVWYASDAFGIAWKTINSKSCDAIAARLVTVPNDAGERLTFPKVRTRVTRSNVWSSAIEAGLFLSRDLVANTGLFDTSLGLGASTPWQSGEGTDLLLRALSRGCDVVSVPECIVYEEHVGGTSERDKLNRIRKYARGTGHVYRHRYGMGSWAFLVAKSVAALVIAAGSPLRRASRLAVLIGRVEGIVGRTLGNP